MMNENFRERRDGMGGPVDFQVPLTNIEASVEVDESDAIMVDQLQMFEFVLLEQEGI